MKDINEMHEMKEDTKKAIADLDVIRSVIDKTRCDMSEISSFFMIIGLLKLLTFLILIPINLQHIELNILLRSILSTSTTILLVGIILYYYRIIKRKNNQISIAIIQLWFIITILLPLIWRLGTIGMYVYNNMVSSMKDITVGELASDISLFEVNFQVILVLTPIIIVGVLLQNKNILIMAAFFLILYFSVEVIYSGQREMNDFKGDITIIFSVSYFAVNYLSTFLLGVILKLAGRKKMNGIE